MITPQNILRIEFQIEQLNNKNPNAYVYYNSGEGTPERHSQINYSEWPFYLKYLQSKALILDSYVGSELLENKCVIGIGIGSGGVPVNAAFRFEVEGNPSTLPYDLVNMSASGLGEFQITGLPASFKTRTDDSFGLATNAVISQQFLNQVYLQLSNTDFKVATSAVFVTEDEWEGWETTYVLLNAPAPDLSINVIDGQTPTGVRFYGTAIYGNLSSVGNNLYKLGEYFYTRNEGAIVITFQLQRNSTNTVDANAGFNADYFVNINNLSDSNRQATRIVGSFNNLLWQVSYIFSTDNNYIPSSGGLIQVEINKLF